MLNAILWILRTGAPWRDLPERYGPWQSAYDRFTRWQAEGVLDRVRLALGELPLETGPWETTGTDAGDPAVAREREAPAAAVR